MVDDATVLAQAVAPRRSRLPFGRLDPLGVLGIILLIAIWQGLSMLMPPSALPSPWSTVATLVNNFFVAPDFSYYGLADPGYFSSLLYTIQNVLMAVAAGGSFGILLGLITARLPLFRAAIDPVMLVAGTVPIIIASPFMLLWFGVERASAVLVVTFYVSVTLYVYAQRAAENLDPVYENSARTLGAAQSDILWTVLLPGTVPEILGGLRIALAGAWGLEAISELMGSARGIGKMIQGLAVSVDVQGILAALLLLGLTAILFDWLTAFAIFRLSAWNVRAGATSDQKN
jgi:ABC-type nitrate/sulfonate/bicarbonate transport system permease component